MASHGFFYKSHGIKCDCDRKMGGHYSVNTVVCVERSDLGYY
jgi:hypothetical protein